MTPLLQLVAIVAATVGALAFFAFVLNVLWKLISGEAARLETGRRAAEEKSDNVVQDMPGQSV